MASDGTTHGALHEAFSVLVFAALPAACSVVAYRFATSGRRGWAGYSVGTAVAFLAGFVLFGMGFSHDPTLMPIGGLLQRLTIIVGWAWLTALALDLLRRASEASPVELSPKSARTAGGKVRGQADPSSRSRRGALSHG